jgi:hypothetical protein
MTMPELLQETESLAEDQKGGCASSSAVPSTKAQLIDTAPITTPPIFVVGVWRCGSTLLYLLLNQHPDIRLFFESDLPVLWPMFQLPWQRQSWVKKWEYWNASVSRHDLDPVRLAAAPVTSLAEAFTLAGREYAGQKGKNNWGCKSPTYYDRLDYLAREFPGARFVVVWRDPEEICRSVINAAARSGDSGSWFARPGSNHRSVLASRTLQKQVQKLLRMGASVHQIHYRDLVNDTASTMQGVCQFLAVPFDPSVTSLDQADRSAVYKGAHHSLARSGNIVSTKNRHQPLPPDLADKINRYRALWKSKYVGKWFLSDRFPETTGAKPSLWERFSDRGLFTALHLRDVAPQIAFSMLPLWAWKIYRWLKYKDAQGVHRQLTSKPPIVQPHSPKRPR